MAVESIAHAPKNHDTFQSLKKIYIHLSHNPLQRHFSHLSTAD